MVAAQITLLLRSSNYACATHVQHRSRCVFSHSGCKSITQKTTASPKYTKWPAIARLSKPKNPIGISFTLKLYHGLGVYVSKVISTFPIPLLNMPFGSIGKIIFPCRPFTFFSTSCPYQDTDHCLRDYVAVVSVSVLFRIATLKRLCSLTFTNLQGAPIKRVYSFHSIARDLFTILSDYRAKVDKSSISKILAGNHPLPPPLSDMATLGMRNKFWMRFDGWI